MTTGEKIRKSIQLTKQKRLTQKCRVFELKVNIKKLNKQDKISLKMMFVEAKWLYNYLISETIDIFKYDCKNTKIEILNKEKQKEMREIKNLIFMYRQELLKYLKQSIFTLSKKRKKD